MFQTFVELSSGVTYLEVTSPSGNLWAFRTLGPLYLHKGGDAHELRFSAEGHLVLYSVDDLAIWSSYNGGSKPVVSK